MGFKNINYTGKTIVFAMHSKLKALINKHTTNVSVKVMETVDDCITLLSTYTSDVHGRPLDF